MATLFQHDTPNVASARRTWADGNRRPMEGTFALILAGGKGSRLGALTAQRAKPAMPMAGSYRLIDFTLSNCLNSGIRRVGVLVQHLAESLVPHVHEHWSGAVGDRRRFAECLLARGPSLYQGTADAVHQHAPLIRRLAPAHVLVLAGDHAYKMDYAAMLVQHLERRAQITVGCIEAPIDQARAFGVMQVNRDWRIRQFVEKPAQPQPLPGRRDVALASMGIYIFDTPLLLALLERDAAASASGHDFGKDVIRAAIEARAYACPLQDPADPQRPGYWRDVGTIDSYRQTNLEMAGASAGLDIEDPVWPIRAGAHLPGGRLALRRGERAIVSADCEVHASDLRDSVLFPGVRVGCGSTLHGSVVLAGACIGAGSVIRNAVIEEGCVVPDGAVIGAGGAGSGEGFHVTPGGSVLVTREMLEQARPRAASKVTSPARPFSAAACAA